MHNHVVLQYFSVHSCTLYSHSLLLTNVGSSLVKYKKLSMACTWVPGMVLCWYQPFHGINQYTCVSLVLKLSRSWK
jgi:hypothetical protein